MKSESDKVSQRSHKKAMHILSKLVGTVDGSVKAFSDDFKGLSFASNSDKKKKYSKRKAKPYFKSKNQFYVRQKYRKDMAWNDVE